MTATTLLGGHNTAIGTPTRLRTILKLGKSGTPGITYKRARTRPAAGSRISSTTTIDLATWTYYKVSYIIRTGAVKTAQDRVCAHGVDRGVGSVNGLARASDRLSMPQTRLSILCYRAGQARPAGLATAASGPSTAALLSRIATAARLRTQRKKRVSGMSGHAHAAKELLLHRQRIE